MKRILSLMLVAMLLIGCMSTVAFAAGERTGQTTLTLSGPLTSVTGVVSADNGTVKVAGPSTNGTTIAYADLNNNNVGSLSYTATVTVPANFCGDVVVSFSTEGALEAIYDDGGLVKTDENNFVRFESINLNTSAVVNFGHESDGNWTVKVPSPDCVTPATLKSNCKHCGEEMTMPSTEDPDGAHDWDTSKWEKDATGHWHVCKNSAGHKSGFAEHDLDWVNNDANVHWQVCSVCEYETAKEAHNLKHHKWNGYWYCECGRQGEKVVEDKPVNPDNDDVAGTGDITPYGTYNAMIAATLIVLFGSVALISKRKFVK